VDGDDETSVDAVDVGEPVHRHQEEVEVVDGGTLDDPVDPTRKVIRSNHFRFLSETKYGRPRQWNSTFLTFSCIIEGTS